MIGGPTRLSMHRFRGAIAPVTWPAIWPVTFTRALIYVILVMIAIVEAFPLVWMFITSSEELA